MSFALEIKNVSKRFGGVVAAQDVSLSLSAGKITALVGPNGAGKTTIFNLITGNLTPDTGTVHLGGRDVTGSGPRSIARSGVARSFQDLRLFNQMTVFDNVLTVMERRSLPWQPGGLAGDRRRRLECKAILGTVGLGDLARARAVDLGYAQQKFLSLARILAMQANVWLLDEPASGLDPGSFTNFVRIVRAEAAAGKAVCVIEHNLEIVLGLADTIVFLDQGAVLASGEPARIMGDPELAAIYFGGRPA
jgi:branched-chain amino acid transport system ATP-binding protein